jgi:hypothetical protein
VADEERHTPRLTARVREAKFAVHGELRATGYVPVSAAPPLTLRGNAVCTRTTLCRPTTAADRAQCDAQIMPRAPRRTPKTTVQCCGSACAACVTYTARSIGRVRAMSAAAPQALPRRTRRAC